MNIDNLVLYHKRRKAKKLSLYRGDSYPLIFYAVDKTTGEPADISGLNFTLTASSVEDPPGAADQVFSLLGINSTSVLGEVSFTPSSSDTDLGPATYYYDVQVNDTASGQVFTVTKNPLEIKQDITKDVSSSGEYATTFDNDDLVGGVLTVNHGLGDSYPIFTVWDGSNEQVGVSMIPVDDDRFQIDLGGPITGTWLVSVRVPSWRKSVAFDSSYLVAGVLTVNHGLGTAYPSVAIYDNNNRKVGASVTSISTTQFSVDFSGTITGTWHLTAV